MAIATAMYGIETGIPGLPPSFRQWQKRCQELNVPPVIAVAGSRGKSSVVRMLQAIFDRAGIQSAIWTDFGVEINGRRQRGEIAGWDRAMKRLTEQTLDIGVQELDWNLVAAVGLPVATYPISMITSVCSNDARCLLTNQGQLAMRSLDRVTRAAHPDGIICVNGEDTALHRVTEHAGTRVAIAARSSAVPMMRQNASAGVPNVWVEDGWIRCGTSLRSLPVCRMDALVFGLGTAATFEVTNLLLAASAALSTGIGVEIVASALTAYRPSPTHLPGSLTVRSRGTIRTVVDRIGPSWFLRPLLKAVNPKSSRRQITLVGGLDSLPMTDAHEVGRLLGRTHGAVILWGEADEERVDALRQGLATDEYPPAFLQLDTERRAINRLMKSVRENDVVLFLTHDDPGPAMRAIDRLDIRTA